MTVQQGKIDEKGGKTCRGMTQTKGGRVNSKPGRLISARKHKPVPRNVKTVNMKIVLNSGNRVTVLAAYMYRTEVLNLMSVRVLMYS